MTADQNVEFVASSRITDHQILEAFEGAGHRPLRTWDDNNGTTYQSHYVFDEDEWNAMHDKLWQAAGYTGTGLDARVAFYCEGFKGDPWTYTSTLGVVVGSICGGFHWGVSYAGKVQIVKRTKIRPDGPHIDNRYGNAIIVSAKFIWKLSAFAGAIYCNNAMNYGISNACSAQISVKL
ncbi:hypothetical protein M7I_2515 [Glarea lozoyensis 74030]|uniref:Uncharacterized protein n=1 Tax=Glarea lozoyensis (strain ATCC 74030 / MF5533) TaxID=1104152 RepID=H0EIZ3_GLAL7|nr:hypothetical protein M7I_2515 [Glarea lozoyensis 74030]